MNLSDVYRDLRRLRPSDRAWIFERLSSSAKIKLARGLGADGPLYEPTATAKAMRQLDARDAATVLDALKGEPSWVIWAVWRAANWTWRAKLLRGLAPNVKVDLQTLERERGAVSPAVTQFLVRALAERIAATAAYAPPPSRFERMLRRLKRRAA